jgi:hypothetical protein
MMHQHVLLAHTTTQEVERETYIQSVALVQRVPARTGLIQCVLTADQANQNIVTGNKRPPYIVIGSLFSGRNLPFVLTNIGSNWYLIEVSAWLVETSEMYDPEADLPVP